MISFYSKNPAEYSTAGNPQSQSPNLKSESQLREIRTTLVLGFGIWDLGFGIWDLLLHSPDLVECLLERIDVHHPAEELREEAAARGGARLRRRNRPLGAKLLPIGARGVAAARETDVDVRVPSGDGR